LHVLLYILCIVVAFYATCIRADNRGGIISSVGKIAEGNLSEKTAGHKVSIARDLVVLGVSSVNPREGPFLFRDILSPTRYLSSTQDRRVAWTINVSCSEIFPSKFKKHLFDKYSAQCDTV